VVWFENAYSALAKLALAQNMQVGGAYLWLAGDEDDLLWRNLSTSSIARAAKSAAHRQKVIEP
jgi:spore germination protein YaaH